MEKLKIARDDRSAKIDFTDWNLNAIENLNQSVYSAAQEAVKEGMALAAEIYDAHAWFPTEWDFGENPSNGAGGKPPTDPSTIYVELPLGPSDDENPRWSFTLSELVEQLIDGGADQDGIIGTEHVSSSSAIRDCFRALADKIDAALPKQSEEISAQTLTQK